MANTTKVIYCRPGDVIAPGVGTVGTATYLPPNSFQARAYADGEDVHEGVLVEPGEQDTYEPPHPLRNCMRFQWYYDNLKGEGIQAIEDATSDTYTVSTAAVRNSGEYWCRMEIGPVEAVSGQRCTIIDSPRIRLIIIDCKQPQQPFLPYEGGEAEVSVLRPNFIAALFQHPTADNMAPEWIGSLEQSRLSTVTYSGALADIECDEVETVFSLTIAPGENEEARQGYATIEIGAFECKYPVTQDYPVDGTAVEVPADEIEAQRSNVGGNVEIFEGLLSNLDNVLEGDAVTVQAQFTALETSDASSDVLGGCDGVPLNHTFRWEVPVGLTVGDESSFRICEIFGNDPQQFTTGTAAISGGTAANSPYTINVFVEDGSGNVVAADSAEISWATPDEQLEPTVINYLSGPAALPSVTNIGSFGMQPTRRVEGTIEILNSPADLTIRNTRGGWFGNFANISGGPTIVNYTFNGPTMLSGTLTTSSTTDGLESEVFETQLNPGIYNYTLEILENSPGPNTGNGTMNLVGTVFAPIDLSLFNL